MFNSLIIKMKNEGAIQVSLAEQAAINIRNMQYFTDFRADTSPQKRLSDMYEKHFMRRLFNFDIG